MKEAFDIAIVRIDRTVVMQVLDMPEECRAYGIIFCSGPMCFTSEAAPEIIRDEEQWVIILRGTSKRDDFFVAQYDFDTATQAATFASKLRAAVTELNDWYLDKHKGTKEKLIEVY